MSDIKIGNFLNTEELVKVKENRKKELEETKQNYFKEFEMLFTMQNLMEFNKFMVLYNDICDNLNKTIEDMEAL